MVMTENLLKGLFRICEIKGSTHEQVALMPEILSTSPCGLDCFHIPTGKIRVDTGGNGSPICKGDYVSQHSIKPLGLLLGFALDGLKSRLFFFFFLVLGES